MLFLLNAAISVLSLTLSAPNNRDSLYDKIKKRDDISNSTFIARPFNVTLTRQVPEDPDRCISLNNALGDILKKIASVVTIRITINFNATMYPFCKFSIGCATDGQLASAKPARYLLAKKDGDSKISPIPHSLNK